MTPPDRFEVSRHFDAALAERYERRIRMFCPSYDALHEMIGTLLNRLPKDASILSAGAGTGAEVIRLGMRFPSWRFVAADISPDMLHVCQERVEGQRMSGRVEYFHGCLRDYRPQLPFDAATSIFVSHFILSPEERQAHFQAIADSLKPGGILVFGDLYGDRHSASFSQLLASWLDGYAAHGVSEMELDKDRQHIERDIAFIPEGELLDLLERTGFSRPVRFYQTFLFGAWMGFKL